MEKGVRQTFVDNLGIPSDTQKVFTKEKMEEYQEMMMMYNCTILEVKTKLEVLNAEFAVMQKSNPIQIIKSRIKTPESIELKLEKRGLEVSVDSAMENLDDIAGIRVVCAFIDDIYEVARMIAKQDDIKVIKVKDYIKEPKENGYRSYHMIVELPVFFPSQKRIMRAEIQIRTIAMDFWASLEHQLKYKKDVKNPEKIGAELKECASIISYTDNKMQEIKEEIHKTTV